MLSISNIINGIIKSIKEGTQVYKNLFPMLVSVVILVKILQEMNLIQYVAMPLEPIMQTMGLPAEFGIVWACAILVNIYSALALIPSILVLVPSVTVEQMTVLGLIILIAHNLIIESKIAGRCGLSSVVQAIIRIVTAWFSGLFVYFLCSTFGFWQEPAKIIFEPGLAPDLQTWIIGEIKNLIQIYFIICAVMMFNKAINTLKLSNIIGFILSPILRMLGISREATNIVIVGLILGVLYGSGIIIQSVAEGKISRGDVFSTMSLMSIAHALIEDTILLSLIGGSLWGLLGIRVFFAILVGVLINTFYTKRKYKNTPQKGIA